VDSKDIGSLTMHPLAMYFVVGGILILTILIITYFIYSSWKTEKKRTNGLKEAALRSGFSFSEDVDVDCSDLQIFRPNKTRIWNMLKIDRHDALWRIFDYKGLKLLTIFMAETKRSFPKFSLIYKSSEDYSLEDYNPNDIEFDGHPEFSKQYYLTGTDKTEIRKLFSADVIRHFETFRPECMIDANGRRAFFFKLGVERVKPEDLTSKLEDAAKLLSLFL